MKCQEIEKFCQKVMKMSGSFYDVLSEDIPYFMFSVQYEKNLNVK